MYTIERTYSGAFQQISDETISMKPQRSSPEENEVVVRTEIRGRGAFKESQPIHAAPTTDPANAIVVLGRSRKTSFDDYAALSKRLYERGMDYRRMGAAAVDLVRVAEGVSDLFYERHLNAWDMLAGALIAAEAGAKVAIPPVYMLLEDGGPVIAHSPGLAEEFAFLVEFEGLVG